MKELVDALRKRATFGEAWVASGDQETMGKAADAIEHLSQKQSEALSIIRDCQHILAEYLPPEGPNSDPKETISKLLGILDGPRAREVLKGKKE